MRSDSWFVLKAYLKLLGVRVLETPETLGKNCSLKLQLCRAPSGRGWSFNVLGPIFLLMLLQSALSSIVALGILEALRSSEGAAACKAEAWALWMCKRRVTIQRGEERFGGASAASSSGPSGPTSAGSHELRVVPCRGGHNDSDVHGSRSGKLGRLA